MPSPQTILLAEDDPGSAEVLRRLLTTHGYDVHVVRDGVEAVSSLRKVSPSLILLDVMMPRKSGLDACKDIRADSSLSFVPIILVTAKADTVDIVAGLDAGADDYVTKPFEPIELLARVRSLLRIKKMHDDLQETLDRLTASREENVRLRQEIHGKYASDEIVGTSPSIRKVLNTLDSAINGPGPVLITGETGTGKELIARYLHYRSSRRDYPFIVQDCGALPESLVESELFGYRRGAFTGAAEDKKGLLEAAHGGTIFLDEIGEASALLQSRLLRVIQERQIRRIGDTSYRPIDAQIIAATNRDLWKEVESGRFRKDLYYRLNMITVQLPPLRERKEDIPILVGHFLIKYKQLLKRRVERLNREAEDLLLAYPFPGNVRELENEIERAVLLCPPDEEEIRVELLSGRIREFGESSIMQRNPGSLRAMVEELEKKVILEALRKYSGNKSRVAGELGLSRLGLRQKMERYGLDAGEL